MNTWYSALFAPARYTRALLMDIGFGSLIEKLEEYVGRRITLTAIWLLLIWLFTIVTKATYEWISWIFGKFDKLNLPGFSNLTSSEITILVIDIVITVILLLVVGLVFLLYMKQQRARDVFDRAVKEFEERLKR